MAYTEPAYSRAQVDAAGDILMGPPRPDRLEEALAVINNWRASHAYPLNTFQMTLRNRARQVDQRPIVSQRIKRLPAIEDKLRRYDFKLSEMQDIGGCRAVVSSVDQVYKLARIYEQSGWKHTLDSRNDYIKSPKAKSGYRGIHLIYRHFSPVHACYNGHKIEVQLRSSLQHTWATAVETADVFLREGLKVSRGPEEWKRFFVLMGSAIALREDCKRVPRTPKDEKQLVAEINELIEKLGVMTRFKTFGQALRLIETAPNVRNAHYLVLVLDPRANTMTVWGFKASQSESATERYLQLEREKAEGADVVLVSVEHAVDLQRAYPNYFLDTTLFLDTVREVIS
jgi:hypothetical protein